MKRFINKIFKIEENKTTIKTELIAGLTTFFSMCYVIIVNPNQMTGFKPELSYLYNAAFIGGIIAAVASTMCMAFIANKPFVLAAGMGLNSFFFVSYILPAEINGLKAEEGYATGLAIILISGLIFLILTLTGLRKHVVDSLPKTLKAAIPAGIGLFIAFIGFQNANIVVLNENTLVQIADFTKWVQYDEAGNFLYSPATAICAFVGLIIVIVFSRSEKKVLSGGAVVFGIIASTALYYIFSIFTPELRPTTSVPSVANMFSDWTTYGLFSAFKGMKHVFDGTIFGSIFSVILLIVTYCLISTFDSVGTLYGASAQTSLLDENGDPVDLDKEMLADSIGPLTSGIFGTSTISPFLESSSGIAVGGRTGLTSFTTAILLLLCLFIGPIVFYVPSCATSCALIYIGILIFQNVLKIRWDDPRAAATGFMTIAVMIFTYSITNGIIVGSLIYTLFTILTRKFEKKDIVVTIISILGVLKFIFVSM